MPERGNKGYPESIISLPCPSPHYLRSHTAPPPKVFIVLKHPLQRQSRRYGASNGSKLKGNPARHLPRTDSTSPARNAECPVEVPGAELSRSALNKGQGPCQRILTNAINNVLRAGALSTCPVLNGESPSFDLLYAELIIPMFPLATLQIKQIHHQMASQHGSMDTFNAILTQKRLN